MICAHEGTSRAAPALPTMELYWSGTQVLISVSIPRQILVLILLKYLDTN